MTKKYKPLDTLEVHDVLRLIYPEHIKSDDDQYFELSEIASSETVHLGDGFEVTLAELLGRVVTLTPVVVSELTGTAAHALGELVKDGEYFQVRAVVRREV